MSTGLYLVDNPNPNKSQYRSPRRQNLSGVIVIHTAENTPDFVAFDGGAEAVARFIGTRTDYGSYHTLVDSDSAIRMVSFDDEAFHDATPDGNKHEVGLSVATRADVWPLAPQKWRDGAIEQLARAAAEAARHIYAKRGIVVPPRFLTRAESEQRIPGFISHALRDPGRRSDPGKDFPWAQFFTRYTELIADLLGGKPTNPTTPGELTVSEAKTINAKIDREVKGLKDRDSMVYEGTKQALAKQHTFNKILVQFIKEQVSVPNEAVAELDRQLAELSAEVEALADLDGKD